MRTAGRAALSVLGNVACKLDSLGSERLPRLHSAGHVQTSQLTQAMSKVGC
jgi:hypothetical protein